MAEGRKISYIFNVESAEFSEGEIGNTDYEVEVKCTDSVEPNMLDVVEQLCEKYTEINRYSGVVIANGGNWWKRLPTWTSFVAVSIGVVNGCLFIMKFDKNGDTIGQIAKQITVAAKGVTVTANAATAVINQLKA